MKASRIVVAFLVLGAGARPIGQARPAVEDPQSITTTTSAVLVDVVVRDKRGQPVTTLSAGDFAVEESGVPQKIDSFSRVSRGSGIGVGVAWRGPDRSAVVSVTPPDAREPGAPDTAPAATDDATTALVFDHLSSESLRLAQRATLDYVPMTGESGVRVAVFATNPGVRLLQPYTTDRAAIRHAVAQVTPSGVAADESRADRTDELLSRRRTLDSTTNTLLSGVATGAGGALTRNTSEIGERETERALLQTELNMIRSFDSMDRDHRGYDTTLALLSVIRSLSVLPGRKTIVFFSEGLPVSPVLSARLDALIDAANRANVTAYAVDANGLRSKSDLTPTRKEIEAFADERFAQNSTGNDHTNQPLTMAFERVEDTFRLDSHTGLARLADETGGFLVGESNDLGHAFTRIDEDNRFHYLLTYSPTNNRYDGTFRPIRVKVRSPGYEVFARKGYRALPAPRGIDTGSFETPALAMLDRSPLPNAFAIHARGFTFPDPQRPGLTPVVVRVATDALQFTVDRQRGSYAGQVSIVVRLRDAHGQTVQTLSQQYVLTGVDKDLAAAGLGELLFYREASLPPGVYSMETIVFDAAANKGSARVETLTVPPARADAIGMSSLVLVSKVEEVGAEGQGRTAPLYVGNLLLYPNLGETISKADTTELPFYFALYGDVRGAHATTELLSNGRTLAQAPLVLPSGTGARVQHVGRLPIAALPPGTYELRIAVNGGAEDLSRSAFFTLRN